MNNLLYNNEHPDYIGLPSDDNKIIINVNIDDILNNKYDTSIETKSTIKKTAEDDQEIIEEEKDNWERFDYYNAEVFSATGRYRIDYEDQRGLKTEREIKIKRVYKNNNEYAINAQCLLRNANRSFINDGIKKAINLDTGNIVENVAIDSITNYNNSSEGLSLAAINKEWNGVAVLAFVSRIDGRILKAERLIIAEYLKRHCFDLSINDDDLDSNLKSLFFTNYILFQHAISELQKNGEKEKLKDLLGCATRIIASHKRKYPMAKSALKIISNAIL